MFLDRGDAGRQLAHRLEAWRGTDLVVLGLPRGGVPVAAEVARALGASLDVIVVRKVGVPWQPELAMGAVGEEGVRVLNDDVLRQADVSADALGAAARREAAEVERRAQLYRGNRPRVSLTGRTALIVDDGIATGATARAACQVARAHGAGHVVLAVPVAPHGWTRDFASVADECVDVEAPKSFFAVGAHYRDFTPTSDEEVVSLLTSQPPHEEQLAIPCNGSMLAGTLTLPSLAQGLIVFAHGSGSSHRSVRNRFVARQLVDAGFATGLFDLLTELEENDRANVFDIEMLTERLLVITDWLQEQPVLNGLPLGYFGASTGAAAALAAAARRGDRVSAVVSRGGRPDLAMPVLGSVTAPTLLIVGGADELVLDLNRQAFAELRCPADLTVVPGATHLFAERGALESVAEVAGQWFGKHLIRR
jgi:putative phosphoribosyl transferase